MHPRIHRLVDWFGLNHYSPIDARADALSGVPRSPIGWQLPKSSAHWFERMIHARGMEPVR